MKHQGEPSSLLPIFQSPTYDTHASVSLDTRPLRTLSQDEKTLYSTELSIDVSQEKEPAPPTGALPLIIENAAQTLQLVPFPPSENPRYDNNVHFIGEDVKEIAMGPRILRPHGVPTGWEVLIHPEGKPYYFNQAMNIATHANVSKDENLNKIKEAKEMIYKLGAPASLGYELIIELPQECLCSYYFVDHQNLTIFWAEKTTPDQFHLERFKSQTQCDLWLQKEYWHHLHNFPLHNRLPEDAVPTLVNALLYGGVDQASSRTSMFAFTADQRETFLSALQTYKNSDELVLDGHRTSTVARIWSLLATSRFLCHHGHEAARIDTAQLVGPARKATWALRLLQIFSYIAMFNIPSIHHSHLERLWLGKIVLSRDWEKFAERLLAGWREITLLATILLLANTSFCSVSNLDFGITLSIWISAVFAIGSIATALWHTRQYRDVLHASALDVANYLASVDSQSLGLLPLAVLYSLPYTFLVWSIVSFAIAILVFALQNFWGSNSGKAAIISMCGIAALLIIYSAYFASRSIRPRDSVPWLGAWKSRTGDSRTPPTPERALQAPSRWRPALRIGRSAGAATDIEARGTGMKAAV
ncbi:hypothetical protein BOTBODRAFT_641516 [Botryobasidium botryosum FD-172 SS1]|uniref:WW domain-containing protein n=1 Tax=Botryobasidium botryosum (strain FD-172 SS1) TaxID=930990 RepID=A0A067MRN6_BOTB1|nr:hypothetical protein BOTBODRAFT_641516 [Botryobasidium botryosum FD-172 SS1]